MSSSARKTLTFMPSRSTGKRAFKSGAKSPVPPHTPRDVQDEGLMAALTNMVKDQFSRDDNYRRKLSIFEIDRADDGLSITIKIEKSNDEKKDTQGMWDNAAQPTLVISSAVLQLELKEYGVESCSSPTAYDEHSAIAASLAGRGRASSAPPMAGTDGCNLRLLESHERRSSPWKAENGMSTLMLGGMNEEAGNWENKENEDPKRDLFAIRVAPQSRSVELAKMVNTLIEKRIELLEKQMKEAGKL